MEEPEVTETLAIALDAGINYFDNARSTAAAWPRRSWAGS